MKVDGSDAVYWAVKLSILMDDGPGRHITRLQDGRGYPTKKEIIKAKKELDKAFEIWLNQ